MHLLPQYPHPSRAGMAENPDCPYRTIGAGIHAILHHHLPVAMIRRLCRTPRIMQVSRSPDARLLKRSPSHPLLTMREPQDRNRQDGRHQWRRGSPEPERGRSHPLPERTVQAPQWRESTVITPPCHHPQHQPIRHHLRHLPLRWTTGMR